MGGLRTNHSNTIILGKMSVRAPKVQKWKVSTDKTHSIQWGRRPFNLQKKADDVYEPWSFYIICGWSDDKIVFHRLKSTAEAHTHNNNNNNK